MTTTLRQAIIRREEPPPRPPMCSRGALSWSRIMKDSLCARAISGAEQPTLRVAIEAGAVARRVG